MKKYDHVFILDYNSLLSDKLFSIHDIEESDVRIATPEIKKLNNFIAKQVEYDKKDKYKSTILKINELLKTKKISAIGDEGETHFSHKLLEVIVKNYYLKNILIISNIKESIEKFLPLIPVYEAFNKTLDIGYVDNILKFYEFSEQDEVNSLLDFSEDYFDE